MRDVSDTALLTAEMRAEETERPDRLFDDGLARVLAGDRAGTIAPVRRRMVSSGGVVARTAVLDEVILRLLDVGMIERVVNLGAGLDTRPYRLDLPRKLRWVEADLPGIVEYKTEKLSREEPRCAVERFSVDLGDASARSQLLAAALSEQPSLVITEGVVPYLRPEDVAELASELRGYSQVRYWWLDLVSSLLLRLGNRFGGKKLARADAVGRFAPEEGPAFFTVYGWSPVECRSTWLEQRRLHREPFPMRLVWQIAPTRLRRSLEEIATLVLLQPG